MPRLSAAVDIDARLGRGDWAPMRDVRERFWEKVAKGGPDDCWLWQAGQAGKGYGAFSIGPAGDCHGYAHRAAYALEVGPIPEGMYVDHLELVTNRENILRGVGFAATNARKTHCPQGHPYDLVNTYVTPNGGRQCHICRRRHIEKLRAKRAEEAKAA